MKFPNFHLDSFLLIALWTSHLQRRTSSCFIYLAIPLPSECVFFSYFLFLLRLIVIIKLALWYPNSVTSQIGLQCHRCHHPTRTLIHLTYNQTFSDFPQFTEQMSNFVLFQHCDNLPCPPPSSTQNRHGKWGIMHANSPATNFVGVLAPLPDLHNSFSKPGAKTLRVHCATLIQMNENSFSIYSPRVIPNVCDKRT